MDYAILLICQRIARHSARLYLMPTNPGRSSHIAHSCTWNYARRKTMRHEIENDVQSKLTNRNDTPNALSTFCGRLHLLIASIHSLQSNGFEAEKEMRIPRR